MPGRSFRIARIAGIPIGVSPWWLAIVWLISWSLGSAYFPDAVPGIAPAASYGLGLLSALLLFASILVHELGHAIVARRHGVEVEGIDLWLLGGVARMRGEAHAPRDELLYAIAGPAVTAVITLLLGVAALAIPGSAPAVVRALVEYQLIVNALILGFNMLPAYPLDGGRVLHALLWQRHGDLARATATATAIGRGFGFAMMAVGLLELVAGAVGGLWLAFIGVFVVAAADAQRRALETEQLLGHATVASIMSSPAVTVPAGMSVAEAIGEFFVTRRMTAFPVVDVRGRVTGLLTIGAVEAVDRELRPQENVGALVDRDPQLTVGPDDDVTELLQRPSFVRVGRAAVVDDERRALGVVSVTDVRRALRAAQLGPRGGSGAAAPPRATLG